MALENIIEIILMMMIMIIKRIAAWPGTGIGLTMAATIDGATRDFKISRFFTD